MRGVSFGAVRFIRGCPSLEHLRRVLRLVRKVASHIVIPSGTTSEFMTWLGCRSEYERHWNEWHKYLVRLVVCRHSLQLPKCPIVTEDLSSTFVSPPWQKAGDGKAQNAVCLLMPWPSDYASGVLGVCHHPATCSLIETLRKRMHTDTHISSAARLRARN